MRILQLSPGVYPFDHAGVEVYTHQLSQELLRQGHDVLIAAAVADHSDVGSRCELPLFPLPLPKKSRFGNDIDSRTFRRIWAQVERAIASFRPEMIHVQHLHRVGWQALAQLNSLGIPFVVSLPDYWYLCRGIKWMCEGSTLRCVSDCLNTPPINSISYARECLRTRSRRRKCVASFNRIGAPLLPLSRRTAEIYADAGVRRDKMLVHPWGVDCQRRREIGVQSTPPRIRFGYLGTLVREKGVHVLIKAINQLKSPASLEIYGTGDLGYIRELQRLAINQNVRFRGRYDVSDLPDIMARLDAVVVPSLWEEAYGLVAQEALAARKIVIASSVGGLGQMVVNGVNGFLVPPNDPAALAAQMERVAENFDSIKQTFRFDLNLTDLVDDSEWVEKLYQWTIERWRRLTVGEIMPVEFEWAPTAAVLANYLGEDIGSVRTKLATEWRDPGSTVRDAWNHSKPITDDDITRFYKDTDSYLYDLIIVHRTYERKAWREAAGQLLIKYGAKTLFDYGGGCGDDSLWFNQLGIKCTIYEFSRYSAGMARARAKQLGISIVVVDDIPRASSFDAVYCTEVLEHATDPMGELKKMSDLLCPGGILLVTHSFELLGDSHPSHLEKHRWLATAFISEAEKLDLVFTEIVQVPGNRFYVFTKSVATERPAATADTVPLRAGRVGDRAIGTKANGLRID
jgi:glycosyltransferase involved in cell wall biosynthesis/ubiquinone/menaquinone biosynthesis C-methylase UbiE